MDDHAYATTLTLDERLQEGLALLNEPLPANRYTRIDMEGRHYQVLSYCGPQSYRRAWGVKLLGGECAANCVEARRILIEAMFSDPDPWIRRQAASELSVCPSAVDALLAALDDSEIRSHAACALTQYAATDDHVWRSLVTRLIQSPEDVWALARPLDYGFCHRYSSIHRWFVDCYELPASEQDLVCEQLTTFQVFVEYGSLNSAAEHLICNRQTVAERIKALGRRLGTPLIESRLRDGPNRMDLTITGEAVSLWLKYGLASPPFQMRNERYRRARKMANGALPSLGVAEIDYKPFGYRLRAALESCCS